MNKKNYSHHFLFFAIAASIVVVYFIAKPFFEPLILAAVFAFLFQSIYKKFLDYSKNREGVAALATTGLAIILILVPMVFFGTQIFKESSQLYQSLVGENIGGFFVTIENIINQALKVFPILSNFELNLEEHVKKGLEMLIQNFGVIFSGLAGILLNSFVFLIAFYFFLKDGHKLKNYFVTISPLSDNDNKLIVSRLKIGVLAAIKGNLSIGLIQGTLTGIGFAIFGVPNPVLWGGVAVVAAFIPGIGTALVVVPAIIFLFLTGNTFGGVGLLIWGLSAVGLVDNFLGPQLVGRGMHLHPLAVFISVLGGIIFFGPLGFLLGPLTMSVCLVLIDIYSSLKVHESKEV